MYEFDDRWISLSLHAQIAAQAAWLQHNYHKSNLHLSWNLVLILALPG